MNIGPHSFEEFIEEIRRFHGSVAPGVVAGGIMVDVARAHLPEGDLFDLICETPHCLPDAAQLLTPCTIGNRWLKIVDTGRYALTFYNKHTGDGIRVCLDAKKLGKWPAVKAWFLKEKGKKDQVLGEILDEFRRAGRDIYSIEKVKVKEGYRKNGNEVPSRIDLCPSCGEAFRMSLGALCPACRGEGPYDEPSPLSQTGR